MNPVTVQQSTIQHPAADPAHPNHWAFFTALVTGLFNSMEPIISAQLSPKNAAILDEATAVEAQVIPVVLQFSAATDTTPAAATITTAVATTPTSGGTDAAKSQ